MEFFFSASFIGINKYWIFKRRSLSNCTKKCFKFMENRYFFFENILSDKKITTKIPVNKLKKLFDFGYHTKKIDIIFKRCLKKSNHMNKGNKLYEGKAKIIYETKDKNLVIQHFKDDATAFNNLKKAKVEGKGVLNNRISEYILTNLSQCGIKTHLIKRLNMREQLIKRLKFFLLNLL